MCRLGGSTLAGNALLALADGTVFRGKAIGYRGVATGEVVFNTAMTGYQEILTDPSYAKQLVALTYPHIGNVGTNPHDVEAQTIHASGLIIRDAALKTSNWRSTQTLEDYLNQHEIVGISNLDTRALTHHLRELGAQAGCIMSGEIDEALAIEKAKQAPSLEGQDLAKVVTTPKSYQFQLGTYDLSEQTARPPHQTHFHVVAYDFGIKEAMLRLLVDRGCHITVVPATTPAKEVLALNPNPDGILLSNGPGDPDACDYAIEAAKVFLDKKLPVFGICLGFQILALAAGAKTIKMKYGHHGANHPVQDCQTGRVAISSQNHGFCVSETDLPQHITVTHRSLFDNTIQGISLNNGGAFGLQGHPEASPGPSDLYGLFDRFISYMDNYKRS